MSKEKSNKGIIEELKQKFHDKTIEKKAIEAESTIEETLPSFTYDVYQDPDQKSRAFLMVKLHYNPDTREAVVMETRPLGDKVFGLSFVANKGNLEYLFNKCSQETKNEHK